MHIECETKRGQALHPPARYIDRETARKTQVNGVVSCSALHQKKFSASLEHLRFVFQLDVHLKPSTGSGT
jgi:hypothetical protein